MKKLRKRVSKFISLLLAFAMFLPFTNLTVFAEALGKLEMPTPLVYLDMENVISGKVINKANGQKITVEGAPLQKMSVEGGGKALYFDGGTNYINLGKDIQFKDQFTVAAWINMDEKSGGRNTIFGRGRTTVGGNAFDINVNREADMALWYVIGTGASSGWANTNDVIKQKEWHHVVVTGDANDTITYIDGVEAFRKPWDSRPLDLSGNPNDLLLGSVWNKDGSGIFTPNLFTGLMDEVYVYDKTLNAEQVMELKAPRENAKPLIHLDMENISGGKVVDLATGKSYDVSGTVRTEGSINGTKSLRFDGATNYVNLGKDIQFKDQFTLATWIKMDDVTDLGRNTIFGRGRTEIQGNAFELSIDRFKDQKSIFYNIHDGTNLKGGWGATGVQVSQEEWHHFAVSGDANKIRLYLDGTIVYETDWQGKPLDLGTNPNNLGLGATWNNKGTGPLTVNMFKGLMDEVYVYNRPLEGYEISELAEVKIDTSTSFEATPYHNEAGVIVKGLETAVEGKKHWLETVDSLPVVVDGSIEGTLKISNGIIERSFNIPEVGGTDFYTSNYKNTYINKDLLKGTVTPEAYL